jgi:hypothetical protein
LIGLKRIIEEKGVSRESGVGSRDSEAGTQRQVEFLTIDDEVFGWERHYGFRSVLRMKGKECSTINAQCSIFKDRVIGLRNRNTLRKIEGPSRYCISWRAWL